MTDLRISEIFQSIQGESSFAGLPFTFIRLSGCNMNCSWCDTPGSISATGKLMKIVNIVDATRKAAISFVCVTGGEPMLQKGCCKLLESLIENEFTVTLETNGSLNLDEVPAAVHKIVDVKCPSSGMSEHNNLHTIDCLTSRDEIKFVIANREDYQFACNYLLSDLCGFKGPVFFSPVTDRLDPAELANWVLSDRIPARVHLQLHKLLKLS